MRSVFQPVTLGDQIRQRDFRDFSITEAVHRPDLVLSPHAHRYPAVTIVRDGGFGLNIGRDSFECGNTGVFFKLGDLKHSNRVGAAGSRSLIIEIRSDHRHALDHEITLPDRSFLNGELSVLNLATSLEREFGSTDEASAMALEGLTLELLAAILRASLRTVSSRPPGWMYRLMDLLHDSWSQKISLREVAAEIGVHPVHVARTFRRHQGCSLGEYVRRLRIDYAARELRETDRKPSEIALAAGFYDQAHFSRAFRRRVGLSPVQYRRKNGFRTPAG